MRNIYFRLLAGLVLIAVIAGIAFIAYNAGVARGEALGAQAPATQNGTQPYPIYGMPWWPFPFFGFGFFGILALLFLFSVAFSAFRFVLWGPRYGWHRMGHRFGYWGERGSDEDIPPMMAEMHRRMHEAEGKPTGQGT